jgi:enoyl-CoA hydratase/carnithine racemase
MNIPTTTVEVSVSDRVAVVRLNGTRVLNALHSSTHRRMIKVFTELDNRDDVGVIVLCGAGRAFCAGSDLREVGALQGAAAQHYVQLDFATKNVVSGVRKPVIAAIQGHCVGGGVELALACDLRIAATDAVFAFREVPLGSIPGSGGLQRLPAVVGIGVAKDWILSGRDVRADEAEQRGLVTRIVEPSALMDETLELARLMAARNGTAMWLAKVALDPEPKPDHGVVAAFQMLAGEACHADPRYAEATQRFTSKVIAQ